MRLEFTPITANNVATFNAYVNAVRCGSFIKFAQYYDKDFSSLFKNVTIYQGQPINTEEKEEGSIFATSSSTNSYTNVDKGKDLSIAYSTLPISTLKEAYNQVLSHREQEFKGVLEEKEVAFFELTDLDKIRYKLLFNYGDKIGGYGVLAVLDIAELLNLYKYFVHLNNEQHQLIEQHATKLKK